MIKVCIFSRSAYPLFNSTCAATFGGAEVDLYLLAVELAKDPQYKVTFVVGDFGQNRVETYGNVTVIKSYKTSQSKISQMYTLLALLKKISADVYIQESASGGTGLIALLVLCMRKRFIYRTASDIDVNGDFIKKNIIEGILYLTGIKLASTVIAQNASHKQELKERYDIESVVIKNAIKIPDTIKTQRQYTLWVGRSEQLKQPEKFIKIAMARPDEKFIMICPPANARSVDRESLKSKAALCQNLTLIDSVPFSEIDSYFRNAKAFVNTSVYEGFPNTFVQSVKEGVPVFSLGVNPDDFITTYKCGFCANNNEEDLLNHLNFAYSDDRTLEQMSVNAYAYAKVNHDITKAIALYKKIISHENS
jgi:glycosyltransferase involved in cell wall biosynthesis